MWSNNNFLCWLFFSVLLSLNLQTGLCQDYEYEDEEEEETRKPTTDPYGISSQDNFLDTFRVLAAVADNPNATVKPVTQKSKTSTTERATRRTTTELSRPAEVANEVHGILSNVGILNIPGIVNSAISIGGEDAEDARTYVGQILNQIFCLPVLNNLSDCGRKRLAEAQKNRASSTTTPRPRRRRTSTTSTRPSTTTATEESSSSPSSPPRRRRTTTTELPEDLPITTLRPASNFIYQLLNRTEALKSSMDAMNIK